MELEEWTKIEVDFGYPKNEANESHILTVLQKIKAEVTVSSNETWFKKSVVDRIMSDFDFQYKLKINSFNCFCFLITS